MTILFSALYFQHDISVRQWLGCAMVFAGLGKTLPLPCVCSTAFVTFLAVLRVEHQTFDGQKERRWIEENKIERAMAF